MRVIDQRIFYYVKDAVGKGYQLEQLRLHLIQNNFDKSSVDEVIQYFYGLQESQIKQYSDSMHRQGFTSESIRQELSRRGYSAELINKILSGAKSSSRHSFSGAILFILLIMVFAGAGFYLYNYTDALDKFMGVESSLDVEIILSDEYTVGEDISYDIVLKPVSQAKIRPYDSKIRYSILDGTGNVRKSYMENVKMDSPIEELSGKISIPSTVGVGYYTLKVVADYKGKNYDSQADFSIVEKTSPQSDFPLDDVSEIPLIDDVSDVNQTSTYTNNPIIPTTSNDKIITFSKSLEVIRSQAYSKNDVLASKNCDKFSSIQKDLCFSSVAQASGKVVYCDKVLASDIKDNCYITFVILGNTQICDKIKDSYSKNYCMQSDLVNQMQQAYLKNDSAKVLELSKKFEPNIYSETPAPPNFEYVYSQVSNVKIDELNVE